MRYGIVALVLGTFVRVAAAGQIKDGESASHANSAAQYQIVETYKFPGFELVQFNLAVLSHYSYLLVSEGEALVVDPGRDVHAYLDYAGKHGLSIKGVFLTHSHADFVAGHNELGQVKGVTIYAGHKSNAEFAHKSVKQGTVIKIGSAALKVLETPGHTPDGLCGLVSSKDNTPRVLLFGDTLFIGSVGRPDLMGGQISAADLASLAFDTWTSKLSKLPDDVQIFPAHGAGSLCGAHLSDEPTSTIGEQRSANPYLKHTSRSDFITAVLEELPEAPAYFKHNAAMNKKGPPLVEWETAPQTVPVGLGITDPRAFFVVDVRDAKTYAAMHIPNSVNIALRGRVETWVGIMVPWDANLVLVGSEGEIAEGARRLHRVGYRGRILPWSAWEKARLKTARNDLVSPRTLFEAMQNGKSPIIVDVRLPNEWMGLRIGNVVNMPLNHLAEMSSKLNPKEPVIAVCNSAFRSSLAVGILERQGFTRAASLDGGSEAWIEAGYPTYSTQMTRMLTTAAVEHRDLSLPERISPDALNRMLMDLPGSMEIVDIRPASAFAEYRIPESVNVHLADLIAKPEYLEGKSPLVIVDRDGTLAMAAGGILAQKTTRRILSLYGGLAAYWRASSFPAPGEGAPASMPAVPSGIGSYPKQAPAESPGRTPMAPPSRPQGSKKVKAGC